MARIAPRDLASAVAAAKPGERIELHAGELVGQVVIDKPLVIEGRGTGTWLGNDTGPVLIIRSSGVELRDLQIELTGDLQHAAILVEGDREPAMRNVKIRRGELRTDSSRLNVAAPPARPPSAVPVSSPAMPAPANTTPPHVPVSPASPSRRWMVYAVLIGMGAYLGSRSLQSSRSGEPSWEPPNRPDTAGAHVPAAIDAAVHVPVDASIHSMLDAIPQITPRPIASNRMTVSASSALKDWRHYTFYPHNLIDDDPSSSWQPARMPSGGVGEWFRISLSTPQTITAFEVLNGFQHVDQLGDLYHMNNRIENALIEFSDGSTLRLHLEDVPTPVTLRLPVAKRCEWFKVTVKSIYSGTKWNDLAVSEFRVFAIAP
jgi:hypothetical protein